MTQKEKAIAIIDNDCLQPSDAIILLEGDGLNRYKEAVRLYKGKWSNKIVFSGGITNYDYGSFPFSDILPYLLNSGIPLIDIIHENKSLNTKQQAYEVINMAIQNNWKRLILVASCEHQYRAYMTFIRQVISLKENIFIFNSPAKNLLWFDEDGWGKRIDRLDIEFKKIADYSKNGDIATYNEVIKYQKWKESLVNHK